MANKDYVRGAVGAGNMIAAAQSGLIHRYVVPATDNTALFIGDFVKTTGTADAVGVQVITQAAAGNYVRGFIVGFEVNYDNLGQIYRPASTLRHVYVCDDPFVIFILQTNGTGLITDVGANADLVVGSGSTATGLSGMEINQSALDTTARQIRILGLNPISDNTVGANCDWLCMINLHELKYTTGT